MRKGLTTLLVILLVLGAMLVSCKAEVGTPADELVSASFELDGSRALSATLEEFDKNDFYWYYAAVKTDTTGLISGQTATYDVAGAVPVSAGVKGLSAIVPGFSQGLWSFKLFAYFEVPETAEEKAAYIYSGEATEAVLKKGSQNLVKVIVSPNPTGDGFLFIDKEHIYLEEASTASHNNVAPVISIEVIEGGDPELIPGTNVKYEAQTGTYRVTVAYTDGFITYATGSVIATVYPGLTTTVTGYVDELVTYAQFDAEQNPDIVKETLGTEIITDATPTTGDLTLTRALGSKTTKVSSATMPAAAAVDKKNELAANVGADAGTSKLKLNLSVDTTEATETTVTYDIGMEAVLEYKKNDQTSVSTSDVKNIDDYVIVVIDLESDITDVSVKHSDVAMIKFADSEAGYAAFLAADVDDDELVPATETSEAFYKGFYCLRTVGETRTLYIKTRSFSPFEVTYSMADYVAVLNGVKYTSLAAAVDAVANNNLNTITLLKNHSGAGIGLFNADGDTARNIVIDLGGYTYTCSGPAVGSTGTQNQAVHLEKGNTVTIKNGTITSVAEATSGVKMLIQNYSNLTLEDVTLDGTKLAASSSRYVLSNNCGEVLICGSTSITAPTGGYALDVYDWRQYYPEGVKVTIDTEGTILGWLALDADGVATTPYRDSITIKNGNFGNMAVYREKGSLSISGGTFTGWNPTGCVAEGYVVVSIGSSVWKVVPAVAKIGNTYYASVADAVTASVAGDTVIVIRDSVETSIINVNKDITIKGADSEDLILVKKNSDRLFNITSSATIKDLSLYASDEPIYVVIGSGKTVNLENLDIDSGWKAIHVLSSGTVNIKDCISSGVYPMNLDVGTESDLTLNATNSEFYGWISWGTGTRSITFDNCSFGAGHGYSHLRPYVATTFKNCTFYGMTMDTHPDGLHEIVSFVDCTLVNKDKEATKIVDKESLLLLLDEDYVRARMAWEVNGEIVIDDRPTPNE